MGPANVSLQKGRLPFCSLHFQLPFCSLHFQGSLHILNRISSLPSAHVHQLQRGTLVWLPPSSTASSSGVTSFPLQYRDTFFPLARLHASSPSATPPKSRLASSARAIVSASESGADSAGCRAHAAAHQEAGQRRQLNLWQVNYCTACAASACAGFHAGAPTPSLA